MMEANDGRKITTWLDTDPDLVQQGNNILDKLGLADARAAMDNAHNEMIQKKHKLRQRIEKLEGMLKMAYPVRITTQAPFDDKAVEIKNEYAIEAEIRYLKEALKKVSFSDTDYREVSKNFLMEIMPVIENEDRRLQKEIEEAQEEYNRTVRQAQKKVTECTSTRERFISKVNDAVLRKFVHANEASILYPVEGVEKLIELSFNDRATTNIKLLMGSIERKEKDIDYIMSDGPARAKVLEDYNNRRKVTTSEIIGAIKHSFDTIKTVNKVKKKNMRGPEKRK